jgi:hypothetical protein
MSDAHLTIYRAVKLNSVIQYGRNIVAERQKANANLQPDVERNWTRQMPGEIDLRRSLCQALSGHH